MRINKFNVLIKFKLCFKKKFQKTILIAYFKPLSSTWWEWILERLNYYVLFEKIKVFAQNILIALIGLPRLISNRRVTIYHLFCQTTSNIIPIQLENYDKYRFAWLCGDWGVKLVVKTIFPTPRMKGQPEKEVDLRLKKSNPRNTFIANA